MNEQSQSQHVNVPDAAATYSAPPYIVDNEKSALPLQGIVTKYTIPSNYQYVT